MRSNEKKYRRSFRHIDRWSSLAWMQEWRIVMRIVSAAAFSLLCACAAPQGPSDGQQTSGSNSDVALRAEPATIASGGSMTLTLDNESGGAIGYNLCASGLERRSGGGWHPLPENRMSAIGDGILGLSGGDPRRTTKAPP